MSSGAHTPAGPPPCCRQVSDREWLATQPGTRERLHSAEAMLAAGRGEEVCFRATDIDGAPVCARRWASLAAAGGDDDMFSADLSDRELQVGRLAECPAEWPLASVLHPGAGRTGRT